MNRRKRREAARAVVVLRNAEMMRLHAVATGCNYHMMMSAILVARTIRFVPIRLLKDDGWRHAHVDMPAARCLSRMEALR